MKSTALTRRQFVQMSGSAAVLGLAGCVTTSSTVDPDAYRGKLIDAHSHIMAPSRYSGPGAYTADDLAAAMTRHGIDKVVAFGALPGFNPANPVIPVYAIPGPAHVTEEILIGHLRAGRYRGIKAVVRHAPFPMAPNGISGMATDEPFKRLARMSADTARPLTLHIEGPTIDDLDALMREYPDATIVMAHAGQGLGEKRFRGPGVSPATIAAMIAKHPNFHMDFSALGPASALELSHSTWDPLIVENPTRFLFGLDIFPPARLLSVIPSEVAYCRNWLGKLPAGVAEQVGYRNAERLWLS